MLSSRFALLSLILAAVGFANASPLANTGSATTDDCTQPTLSDDHTKWSSREFIEQHLPTPITPTPVFWSGHYKGTTIQPRAIHCSGEVPGGASTIGMLMCKLGGFTMPTDSAPGGGDLWTYASQVYAKRTKGKAYVLLGEALVTSTWFSAEFPALRGNANVTSLVSLDAGSCKEECYWHCPNAAKDCKGLKLCVVQTLPANT